MRKQTSSMIASTIAAAIPTSVPYMHNMDDSTPPQLIEGYLLKKKKWPRKGWHKRYFHLDNGLLRYAKTPNAIRKNKIHGKMEVGACVMSSKKFNLTIDLDADDVIFHTKAKTLLEYNNWLTALRLHREYGNKSKDNTLTSNNINNIQTPMTSNDQEGIYSDNGLNENSKLDLGTIGKELEVLSKLLKKLQVGGTPVVEAVPSSPPTKKERKISKRLSRKGHKVSVSSVSAHEAQHAIAQVHKSSIISNVSSGSSGGMLSDANISVSNPDISMATAHSVSSNSISTEHSIKSKSNQTSPTRPSALSLENAEDKNAVFVLQASNVYKMLSAYTGSLESKNDKTTVATKNASSLAQLQQENLLLKQKLGRIHADSAPVQVSADVLMQGLYKSGSDKTIKQSTLKRMQTPRACMASHMSSQSESQLSINESELFYDAEEYLRSEGESSDSEEAESETNDDDISTNGDSEPDDGEMSTLTTQQSSKVNGSGQVAIVKGGTGRRHCLPVERKHSPGGLWNLLRKNVGRDLSKISMPVTMNEPLNALQHLCEELEYTELIEKAAKCQDKFDRMALVAAFAVSSYGATYHRAGQKPFNPVLGETYECIREDRGFKFISEQVSHHPPISACHCTSENFEFWQSCKYSNKFWGKSMEIIPSGTVSLKLKPFDATYEWQKVTTCVHNIMTEQRNMDHYGEMSITCGDVTCKITFVKPGYWAKKKGVLKGAVYDCSGKVMRNLHGTWFEGLYCGEGASSQCIWRTGAMPPDASKYYGFTRFAMELNEIEPDHVGVLPRTDTRFRPDQRCLEEGMINEAAEEKQKIERLQRERRKDRETNNVNYEPKFFEKVGGATSDTFVFKGDYWDKRNEGFGDDIPQLW